MNDIPNGDSQENGGASDLESLNNGNDGNDGNGRNRRNRRNPREADFPCPWNRINIWCSTNPACCFPDFAKCILNKELMPVYAMGVLLCSLVAMVTSFGMTVMVILVSVAVLIVFFLSGASSYRFNGVEGNIISINENLGQINKSLGQLEKINESLGQFKEEMNDRFGEVHQFHGKIHDSLGNDPPTWTARN